MFRVISLLQETKRGLTLSWPPLGLQCLLFLFMLLLFESASCALSPVPQQL